MIIHPETGEVLRHRKPWMRQRLGFVCEGESMTHQGHADACDVNNIVRSFQRTGVLPPNKRQPQYGDVTALQGDMTSLINESRSTIEGAALEVANAKKAKAAKPAADSAAAGTAGAVAPGAEAAPKATG